MDLFTYYASEGINCTVTLEPRPYYCDRGNWIAKLHVTNPKKLFIDEADCWPRYYMELEAAQREIMLWMGKREEFNGSKSIWEEKRISPKE